MNMRMFASGFLAGGVVMGLAAMNFTYQDPADMEKMMAEAMEKYMSPADEHAELAKHAGTWDTELKMWPAPGAPYETMIGTAKLEMIMDGRYLVEHFESDYMGMPYRGAGLTGFDRINGEYQSIWIDNMGTGMSYSKGRMSDGTGEFMGEMPDPMQGKYVPLRTVQTQDDENSFVVTMYTTGPDGSEYKNMEITYTRSE